MGVTTEEEIEKLTETAARTEFALPILEYEDIDIETIKIENRYRKDLGDIEGLAASIKEQGLLQPVGVDRENNLVFGERRIRAFQHLGWSRIPVRRVNVTSIVEGEYAENEVRKDFTASERVAIAEVVRDAMGNRQGQRTDLSANAAMSGKTVDAAARKAGFGSAETYERAKSVVNNGTPELVQAMDNGKVSISAAAAATRLEPSTQRHALSSEDPKKSLREAVVAMASSRPSHVSSNRNPLYRPDAQFSALAAITGSCDSITEKNRKAWCSLHRQGDC